VSYGNDRMLLAWQSGTSMLAQVYDAGTAQTVGDQFTTAVRDHKRSAAGSCGSTPVMPNAFAAIYVQGC
jgi:hypothetical protein